MSDSEMVKCWFCAEEILIDAKKCKHCGEWAKPQKVDNTKTIVKKEKVKEGKIENDDEILIKLLESGQLDIQPEPKQGISFHKDLGLAGWGMVLLVLGGFSAFYFLLFFDTSVPVPTTEFMGQTFGGGRVNNLGLMQNRQNGLIVSSVFAIVGLILFLNGKNNSKIG